MKSIGYFAVIIFASALSACMQNDIEHGMYDTTYPSGQLRLEANVVEPQSHTEFVYYSEKSSDIGGEAVGALSAFRDQGVDAVWINTPATDALKDARVQSITRLLRGMGVASNRINTTADTMLPKNTYRVDVAYATVRAPRCPNWTSSGATNFTNRSFSQMGCASANNIGQMVKNPRDLERGQGNIRPTADRTVMAVESYNAGSAPAPGSSSAASGSGESGSSNSGSSSTTASGNSSQ